MPHGPLHVLIGSTGSLVYGADQWLEAKHGAKSRRTWRKLHLAVDAASGMIVAQTLTPGRPRHWFLLASRPGARPGAKRRWPFSASRQADTVCPQRLQSGRVELRFPQCTAATADRHPSGGRNKGPRRSSARPPPGCSSGNPARLRLRPGRLSQTFNRCSSSACVSRANRALAAFAAADPLGFYRSASKGCSVWDKLGKSFRNQLRSAVVSRNDHRALQGAGRATAASPRLRGPADRGGRRRGGAEPDAGGWMLESVPFSGSLHSGLGLGPTLPLSAKCTCIRKGSVRFCKLIRAGRSAGSDRSVHSCRSTSVGLVPRQAGHDGCPVGSRAFERPYRSRQASWWLVQRGRARS